MLGRHPAQGCLPVMIEVLGVHGVKALNQTRGTLVAEHVERADTMVRRMRGLMFRTALPEGYGLLLKPCKQIHTHFMRFAIDVIFLDRHGRVVAIQAGMAPFRIGSLVKAADSALEVPAGTAARTGTIPGDLLVME